MKSTKRFFFIAIVVLTALLMAACSSPTDNARQEEMFTIGVVNLSPTLDPVYEGFKAGMAEQGYVEGENITYIYDGSVESIEELEPAIQNLLEQDIDLLLSLSTPATQKAKMVAEGTGVPLIFAPLSDPVVAGVVDSLGQPGGNLTGIKGGGSIPKQLEWLLTIAPDTKRVFVPHNPEDGSSAVGLIELTGAADKLDVELVVEEVHTVEELQAVIQSPPDDIDAIFFLPDSLVKNHLDEWLTLALELNLPTTTDSYTQVETGVLTSYGADFFLVGKQVARLADQILQGHSNASDLPVETADFVMGINLKTADAIGLEISDDVLKQAAYIFRDAD